jgi:DNA-binding transcriptional MerR regulator
MITKGKYAVFTIGKLAAKTRIPSATLRYYEIEGLLLPADRSEVGYRLYDEEAIRRIRFIRHAQECGFTLEEIRDLLLLRHRESAVAGEIRKRALEKKAQLDRRIKTMKQMSRTLGRLVDQCCEGNLPTDQCPILLAFREPLQAAPEGEEGRKKKLYGSISSQADKGT